MSIDTPITNYSGRQVDIELLQTIEYPYGSKSVTISTVTTTPKIVAGVQKALQRYVALLLTMLGDVHLAEQQGTGLVRAVFSGRITNNGTLMYTFALANKQVLEQLAKDDNNTAVFGSIPADERIVEAALSAYNIDYPNSTLSFTIKFTTAAGSVMNYVIPVSTSR